MVYKGKGSNPSWALLMGGSWQQLVYTLYLAAVTWAPHNKIPQTFWPSFWVGQDKSHMFDHFLTISHCIWSPRASLSSITCTL